MAPTRLLERVPAAAAARRLASTDLAPRPAASGSTSEPRPAEPRLADALPSFRFVAVILLAAALLFAALAYLNAA